MYRRSDGHQSEFEFVSIEELVPEDHLLRRIDRYIDFSFISDKVRPYYSQDNGRPAIDPVMLFKMIFLGYFYGIRSERQLEQEVKTNVAYRWFLGLKLTDRVPDHSTISLNRCNRFDTGIFQDIFDEIVLQGMKHRLISGRVLMTDSTHIKANANKHKFEKQIVKERTKNYLTELDLAVAADRRAHQKKSLNPRKEVAEEREVKVSLTDSESGYMYREGKPEGFYYLDHRTVDAKYNLITDVHITPGNVHDSGPYVDRLERQIERFGFAVEAVALDSGYLTNPICNALTQRGIFAVIGHRRFHPTQELLPKWKFHYDREADIYICPQQHQLTYRTTTRDGYREYKSNPEICKTCPILNECTRSRNHQKVVVRHVWEDSREKVRQNRLSKPGKQLYRLRKQTIERSFADAKQLHGYRYARFRGRDKVLEQALMTAACQNMKKIALHLANRAG